MSISFDESIDDYHRSQFVSSSKLRDFASHGPRMYHARHLSRTSPPREDSEALVFGKIFEDLVQGRGLDKSCYAVRPDGMTFQTKEGKAWRAAQQAAGKAIIAADDMQRMESMREALADNETALEMIRVCKAQPTIRCDFPPTPGLQARPDWLSLEGCLSSGYAPLVLDLKSTRSLAKIATGRGVIEYGYHVQAAMVRKLLESSGVLDARFFLLACEKAMPFRCQVVEVPSEWLDAGWRWCERQLAKLAGHFERNEWPRVERELVALPPPPPWIENDNVSEDEESAA